MWWIIIAVLCSTLASVVGILLILFTNLSEKLNPELRELRLQHERLRANEDIMG